MNVSAPTSRALIRRKSMLFVGDSIWHGFSTGAGPRPQLVQLIEARGWAVTTKGTQAGTSGATHLHLLSECYDGQGCPNFTAAPTRISGVGAMGTGSVVVICLGANEVGDGATYDRSASQWATDMGTLRDLAEAIADKVILIPPYTGNWTANQITRAGEFASAAPALATTKSSVCLTYRSGFVLGTDRIAADNTHLNDDPGASRAAAAVFAHGISNGCW